MIERKVTDDDPDAMVRGEMKSGEVSWRELSGAGQGRGVTCHKRNASTSLRTGAAVNDGNQVVAGMGKTR